MAKCKYCGAEVAIGERCTYCGSKAESWYYTVAEKKQEPKKRNRLLPLMLSMMIWVQVVRFLEVNIT